MEQPETKEENKPQEENQPENQEMGDLEILPSDYIKYDYNYKVIVIGDSGVGKTSVTYRATKREFLEKISPTLGFEYFPFVLKYKEKVIKLEIWDTCGQESYRSLIKSFFTNSSLAIIVYAIDDLKTFNSVDEWIRQCKTLCSPETKFVLIGNKADVEDEK
jgi:small GTP-binding protein